MKISKLRHAKSGEKVSLGDRASICKQLEREFDKTGFVTSVADDLTSIGLHMKCFTVDVYKLGYNARVNNGVNGMGQILNYMGPVGFKRTSLPTWGQRVEFNQIIQRVLKKNKVTATVKSGPFVICKDGHNYTEGDWLNEAESTVYGHNQMSIIQPLTKEMMVQAEEVRKQIARERRQRAKLTKERENLEHNRVKLTLVRNKLENMGA